MTSTTTPDTLAHRIERGLIQRFGMKRRPSAAARLLALILRLHERGEPFPPRSEAADHCGCTIWAVDGALSVALARGLIQPVERTKPGNVVQRDSVIRLKFYLPTADLFALAAEI